MLIICCLADVRIIFVIRYAERSATAAGCGWCFCLRHLIRGEIVRDGQVNGRQIFWLVIGSGDKCQNTRGQGGLFRRKVGI